MNGQRPNNIQPSVIVGKIIGGVMGLIFAGVGITVLVFLWGTPTNEFEPPLIFRVFGSFISIAFVLVGGGIFLSAVTGGKRLNNIAQANADNFDQDESSDDGDSHNDAEVQNSPGSYNCPRCGAPLSKGADVSPHGDVKCGYCNAWFNVH